ncbi:IclR family transcriptional regulator [Nocardiopsis sp. L17-MgMaSL7]|uniref:IclR family transcriptional regulator n=1 Tax=Nocardiopsis sp. L17-MgMaSL7 TaxID=1938893 RepID=UPI000D70D08B|nr:helix-turn-helix domain-containing protein [Nocardiopsis sp. L17-MgMaSL7]
MWSPCEQLEHITSRGAGVDIQAVDRVGMILALFGPHRESVTSTEAADLIGLNRTTTYRYLTSLVNANVLDLRDDRTYVPGPALVQLGAFALGRRDILRLAVDPMQTLARDTEITAVLSLWGSSSPVVAHVEEPPRREIVVSVRVGMQLSTAAAQTGIFHTFMADAPSVARASRQLPSGERERIERLVRETSERGYAAQVSTRGIAVLATPVWDEHGLAASLALLSTRDVLDVHAESVELAALRNAATTISQSLGAED